MSGKRAKRIRRAVRNDLMQRFGPRWPRFYSVAYRAAKRFWREHGMLPS